MKKSESIISSILCIILTITVDNFLILIGLWPIAIMTTMLGAIYPTGALLEITGILNKIGIKKETKNTVDNLDDEYEFIPVNSYPAKYDKELRYEEDRKIINNLLEENQNKNSFYKKEKGPILIKRKK